MSSASCNRDSLLIVVEDEGARIPKEQLARIFQPFFTTKQKGKGLGLAITQRIVKEHGGKIRVESTPGVGTLVLLDFPVCQEKTVRNRAGSQKKK